MTDLDRVVFYTPSEEAWRKKKRLRWKKYYYVCLNPKRVSFGKELPYDKAYSCMFEGYPRPCPFCDKRRRKKNIP